MDPGLRFWLRYVEGCGGLTERAGDSTLVVLPPTVARQFDLPDELVVTAEPDIAREDGAVLLATGHPVLIQAADAALRDGDVGVVALAAPGTPAPGAELLEQRVRDQVAVEHGRIDVTGLPVRIDRPVLRVGALVTYTVSPEECYQERLECWVDAGSGCRLSPDHVTRLCAAPRSERPVPARAPVLDAVRAALRQAHGILDAAAEQRRSALSDQASEAHRREHAHAREYYADALRSLERRRACADPDRAQLLEARAKSTRQERARRLLEIDEKYQARHVIRPYRLHAVPAARRAGPRLAGAGRRPPRAAALPLRLRLAALSGRLRRGTLPALRRGRHAVGEQDPARLRPVPARSGMSATRRPRRARHTGVRRDPRRRGSR